MTATIAPVTTKHKRCSRISFANALYSQDWVFRKCAPITKLQEPHRTTIALSVPAHLHRPATHQTQVHGVAGVQAMLTEGGQMLVSGLARQVAG